MSLIESFLMKIAVPKIEQYSLEEWEAKILPHLKEEAMKLPVGQGQEEAMIVIDALDKIANFEASRKLP